MAAWEPPLLGFWMGFKFVPLHKKPVQTKAELVLTLAVNLIESNDGSALKRVCPETN